jgi:hypothetical protein
MKQTGYPLLIIVLLGIYSCQKMPDVCRTVVNGKQMEVSLKQSADSMHLLILTVEGKENSRWGLNYPVYRFDYGDITGDSIPEIAVGVIKTTRFDPTMDKRLFIFRITDDGYVRPLWLGSRVAQPLIDFKLVNKNGQGLVRTIEKESSGNYLVAEYRWRGFGLEFVDYVEREISLQKAKKKVFL